jgi:hypothetical protein
VGSLTGPKAQADRFTVLHWKVLADKTRPALQRRSADNDIAEAVSRA